MIVDSLKNFEKYVSLNPRFVTALKFIQQTDFSALEPGKFEIDEKNVTGNLMVAPLKTVETANLEVHNKYIDVQICLRGRETHGWIQREKCVQPKADFDEAKDAQFFSDTCTTYVTLEEGEFVIFFPEDGHQPMIGEGEIRKCILKVLV